MSFYGNVYYLAEQAFAKYAFRNNGVDNIDFPQSSNIVPERIVQASDSNQGLSIDTGNRWIVMTPPKDNPQGNGYTMWHNAPDSNTNELTLVECFSPLQEGEIPPEVTESDIKNIGFSQCIKIPMVTYDKAGHISTTTGAIYYRLPEDPTKELEDRMNDIDGKDGEPAGGSLKKNLNDRMNSIDGKDKEPPGGSLKKNLNNRMNYLDGKDGEPPGGSLKAKLEETIEDFSDYVDDITKLLGYVKNGWVSELGEYRDSLLIRVANLESRVSSLEMK